MVFRYDSDSSQQYGSRYTPQNTTYNDTYSHLESPEKVNSLERNKQYKNPLLSEINTLDSAVYGGGGSYNNYGQKNGQNYGHTSGYSSDYSVPQPPPPPQTTTNYQYQYTPYSTYEQQNKQYDTPQYGKTTNQPKTTSYERSFDGRYDNFPSSGGSYTKFDTSSPHAFQPPPKYEFNKSGDGYTSSEYSTSTFKIPGGTQTDTYKYETYHSASDPIYSTTTEKYYTSTPNSKFVPIDKPPFKNGCNNTFSSNIEYTTTTPVVSKDSDSLEQKMLKKSVTQQVIEKRTVQTTKSTKQESSTKNFRFD